MPWKWTKPPKENLRDTLVRYAMAIDDQFDEENASEKQIRDLTELNEAMSMIKDAQDRKRSCLIINIFIGGALGLCEKYIKLYNITVPEHPSN